MPIIKIEDIAHVRFSAPDLHKMRLFLEDFGISCWEVDGLSAFAQNRLPILESLRQPKASQLRTSMNLVAGK